MTDLVQDKMAELESLCQMYGVARLELFGSAASGSFDPRRSDLDFLVTFRPGTPAVHANRYFGLLASLQDLFQRQIDLIEYGAIQNPYFKTGVDANRVSIYAT
jgi:predicted nucleotidyltransferase